MKEYYRQNGKMYLQQKDIPEVFPFLKKNTVINLIKAKTFPQGKEIGKKLMVWSTDEIVEWLDERD